MVSRQSRAALAGAFIAADALVATENGPRFAEELKPGDDLVVVERDGRLGIRSIDSIDYHSDHQVACLFTSVGDVKVPLQTSVMTRHGLQQVGNIVREKALAVTRIELVRPCDLPIAKTAKITKADVRAVVSDMSLPVIMIPIDTSSIMYVEERIKHYLALADIGFSVERNSRWLVFIIDSQDCSGDGNLASQGPVLAAMTSWLNDGVRYRTRTKDYRLRRRILASIIAEGKAPKAVWSPAYHPAEGWIEITDDWKPFTVAQSATVTHEPTARILYRGAGSLVCGLMVMDSTQTG